MAGKEDNRDIFDKALESDAGLFAKRALGGALGGYLFIKGANKIDHRMRKVDRPTPRYDRNVENVAVRKGMGYGSGIATTGGWLIDRAGDKKSKPRK